MTDDHRDKVGKINQADIMDVFELLTGKLEFQFIGTRELLRIFEQSE